MFETTTDVMILKLKDAVWPFHPENQPRELNQKLQDGHRKVSARSPNEMYGPVWILFTMIVAIVVMSHLVKTLRSQAGYGEGSEQDLADALLID